MAAFRGTSCSLQIFGDYNPLTANEVVQMEFLSWSNPGEGRSRNAISIIPCR